MKKILIVWLLIARAAFAGAVGGVIPPPDWIASSSGPNARQALHQNLKFGMFLHFGVDTFNNVELGDGTYPVANYNPSALNVSQWIATAKAAGANYVIIITKHHDGFTYWNSADTTYGITTPGAGNTTDIVAAAAAACRAQGMQLALYYSLWDQKRNSATTNTSLDAAYNATMVSHLTELLTNYGPICELWLDGDWQKVYSRWGLDTLYKLFREKQPNGVFMVNHTIGDPTNTSQSYFGVSPKNQVAAGTMKDFPSDFRTQDSQFTRSGTAGSSGATDPDPVTFVSNSKTYYLPFEGPITINTGAKWFWHSSTTDTTLQTNDYLVGAYMHLTGQGNVFVLNIPPSTTGQIDATCVAAASSFAAACGITSGVNQVDLAEGKTASASTQVSSTYAPGQAFLGQVNGGPRWAATDTNGSWISVDLGSSQTVRRVAVKEWYDAAGNPSTRLTSYSIQTSPDNSTWTTQATASGMGTTTNENSVTDFKWGITSFTPVSARYVRLLFTSVTAAPTLDAVRVY